VARRWLVGFEPVFPGGWSHRGARAGSWNVEEELVAVAVFGGVTVDLTEVRTLPAEVRVDAYAITGDVDVIVPRGTRVHLSGRHVNRNLRREVPSLLEDEHGRLVRLHVNELVGDVSLRFASERRCIPEPAVTRSADRPVPAGAGRRRSFGWGAAHTVDSARGVG
jgi:hypothetical protein